ncbi:MAG: hypothetical protein NTY33_02190 [Candidatus Moranbacteria bacterium]|nr:hypothetical protein [Candidatus Moranbacteria bacterium]
MNLSEIKEKIEAVDIALLLLAGVTKRENFFVGVAVVGVIENDIAPAIKQLRGYREYLEQARETLREEERLKQSRE